MAPVNTPLIDEARSIFSDLGYEVLEDGDEFRAKRKWREVHVTALTESTDAPDRGDLRCFVTWNENVTKLRKGLREMNPEYEWAIIGVRESGEYEVARAPPTSIAV